MFESLWDLLFLHGLLPYGFELNITQKLWFERWNISIDGKTIVHSLCRKEYNYCHSPIQTNTACISVSI